MQEYPMDITLTHLRKIKIVTNIFFQREIFQLGIISTLWAIK